MADRDDILRRVQGLINKATTTTFDEERDALLAKADELMFKFAIESYELDRQRDAANRKEQIVRRNITMLRYTNPVMPALIDLMSSVAAHTRCRVVYSGAMKDYTTVAMLVGFESDTEYAEMLYTSLWLQMTAHLEPKPDPELSFEENVVMLLENGQTRVRACELLGIPWTHSQGLKLSKIYKQWCLENGDSYVPKSRPIGSTYAVNFARGFVARVQSRFWEIRKAQQDSVEGTGTALALVDRGKEVRDAMAEMFPKLGTIRRRTEGKYNEAARSRGDAAGKVANLGQKGMSGSRRSLES